MKMIENMSVTLVLLKEKTFLRSSSPEVFLGEGALKICSKFTGVHPCQSVTSINLLCNFIKIKLRHGW